MRAVTMSMTAVQRTALHWASRPPGPPSFWYAFGTAVRQLGATIDQFGVSLQGDYAVIDKRKLRPQASRTSKSGTPAATAARARTESEAAASPLLRLTHTRPWRRRVTRFPYTTRRAPDKPSPPNFPSPFAPRSSDPNHGRQSRRQGARRQRRGIHRAERQSDRRRADGGGLYRLVREHSEG